MAAQDQRQHSRMPCTCKVFLKGQPNQHVDVVDMSEMGMRLHSSDSIGVGKEIEITFPAQQQDVKGTVRNERPADPSGLYIGVEFAESQIKLLATVITG